MNNVGLYAFLVVFAYLLVLTSSEPIKWRINLPEGTHNQQVHTSTGTSFSFSLPNTNDIDQSKIRLVDWREWSRMRPSYSATIGAPPLLIVDTDSMIDEKHKSTIPEAMLEEPETTTLNEATTETTTSIETTTTPAPQTTSTPETSTLDDQSLSTTPKPNPDVTLELRNLPDILALLKHLSLIPAVVRSFSSAAMPTSASQDGLPATASNPLSSLIAAASSNSQPNSDLRSRALSANSGYNARSPQFVTATPVESEMPQIFVGRRPVQQTHSNVPSPIVPVNNRQETMRPREVTSNQRGINQFPPEHRLNIYGIDLKRHEIDRESNAYNAPMIQVPSAVSPQQPVMHKQRPRFDLSNLTVNEVEQLESIHRKLFQQPKGLSTNKIELTGIRQNVIEQPSPLPLTEHASSPLNVFQKPQQTSDSLAQQIMSTQSTFNTSALRPEMISELMMIKDIPDLEELTKGMDLSLLSRPGGFALLKEQFIERLIQRTLVQKQMLRRRLRKNHKRRH